MKRLRKNKPFLIFCGVILVIILINWGIRLQCSRVYKSLLNDTALISTFYGGDKTVIDALVKQEKLAYQQIENGNLVYSSKSWLPTPNVVSYEQKTAEGVILPDTKDSLASRQPYRFYLGGAVYVAAPICTADCQAKMFIVYKKALL